MFFYFVRGIFRDWVLFFQSLRTLWSLPSARWSSERSSSTGDRTSSPTRTSSTLTTSSRRTRPTGTTTPSCLSALAPGAAWVASTRCSSSKSFFRPSWGTSGSSQKTAFRRRTGSSRRTSSSRGQTDSGSNLRTGRLSQQQLKESNFELYNEFGDSQNVQILYRLGLLII